MNRLNLKELIFAGINYYITNFKIVPWYTIKSLLLYIFAFDKFWWNAKLNVKLMKIFLKIFNYGCIIKENCCSIIITSAVSLLIAFIAWHKKNLIGYMACIFSFFFFFCTALLKIYCTVVIQGLHFNVNLLQTTEVFIFHILR